MGVATGEGVAPFFDGAQVKVGRVGMAQAGKPCVVTAGL